jgi:tetratricopeptide (TPR) repeat protein
MMPKTLRLLPISLAIATAAHAEIAAPPSLDAAPDTSNAVPVPALEEIPLEPLPGSSDDPLVPTPIEFESIAVDLDEEPGLAPSLLSAASSDVTSLKSEMDQALAAGDPVLAEGIFNEILSLPTPSRQKRDAMVTMARHFDETAPNPAKAAIIYEQLVQAFPDDPESPSYLLRLGRIYRDQAAFTNALNKFYSVLYSSLQHKSGADYTNTSLRAKMEIAHTHFESGDYDKAAELYSRLKLIDMTPEEAAEVAFRSSYIDYLAGDHAKALTGSRNFLATYPTSPLAPEAQYLQIQSLKALGRSDEAMTETLELLRAGREYGRKKPAVWAYWQRKTGNEIANELYESGDALGALSVYQKLAELNDAPTWRGPTVYQIGLCFERLRHFNRAREAYRYIIDKIPASSGGEADPLIGVNLSTLRDMAQWRLENLAWTEQIEKDLFPLLDKPEALPGIQPDFLKPATPSSAQAKPASTPLETTSATTPTSTTGEAANQFRGNPAPAR